MSGESDAARAYPWSEQDAAFFRGDDTCQRCGGRLVIRQFVIEEPPISLKMWHVNREDCYAAGWTEGAEGESGSEKGGHL